MISTRNWRLVLNKIAPYGLLVVLSLPAIKALLAPGFFASHDGDWMVIRLSAFHQSLRDGHFPVRWTQRLNNNYGYPVLNFLYPLPFYLAEPLVLAGVGLVNSVKLVFLLSLVGSAWAMFAWLKRKTSFWPALLGSLLYLYTPYRFLDVYVRGSLGESVAFLFPPLVLLAIDRLEAKPGLKGAAVLGLAFAGLILSHNVLALIFAGMIAGYLVFTFGLDRNRHLLTLSFLGLAWGAAISSFFWYPALTEIRLTRFSQTVVADFQDHFPALRQLIYPAWGDHPSIPGAKDEISFQVGIANYLAILLAAAAYLKTRSRPTAFLIGSFLVGFGLMLTTSAPFWKLTRVLPVIQFPWRFLALTAFASAAALGLGLKGLSRSWIIVAGLVVVLAVFLNRNYWSPARRTYLPNAYYATNEDTTTVRGEYQPKWAIERLPGRADNPVEVVEGRATLAIERVLTGRISWRTEASGPIKIRVNTLYYPGWIYLIDDQKVSPDLDLIGTPLLTLPPGSHRGTAVWQETRSRQIANLVSLIALIGAVLVRLGKRRQLLTLLAVLVLSLGTIGPLLRPGWIPIHDDTQVARVFEMAESLRQGQFPVRWVGNLGYGYGYPLYNYYAPLPYYLGAFLVLLGLNPLLATKLMIGGAMVLSGFGAWLFLKPKAGLNSALLGATLYLYLPFRAVELYVRGAVSELWAMAFLPLTLAGVDCIISQKERPGSWLVLSALSLTGLILSHNLTALIGLPVVMGYALVRLREQPDRHKLARRLLLGLGLALGLAAFYWLPAVVEKNEIDTQRLVAGGGGDFRQHFLFLDQLWDSPWGFAGSAPGRADGMSFKIGKLHLLIVITTLGLSLVSDAGRKNKLVRFLTALLAASVLMTLSVSRPIWELFFPVLSFLQYPWRFLVLISLAVALLGGLLPLMLREIVPAWRRATLVTVTTLLIVGLVVGVNRKYFQPQRYLSVQAQDFTSRPALRWEASKRSDEFLPPGFAIPQDKTELPAKLVETKPDSLVKIFDQRDHRLRLQLVADQETRVFLNIVRFPGWKVWLDGKRVELIDDPSGRLRLGLVVPPGEHEIRAAFKNTPVRLLGNLISLIAGLTALLVLWRQDQPEAATASIK